MTQVTVFFARSGKVRIPLDRLDKWTVESNVFIKPGLRSPGEVLRARLDCHESGEPCPFRSHGHTPTQIVVSIFRDNNDPETIEAIEAASGRKIPA